MDEDIFSGFLDDPIDGFINKYKSKFGKATDYFTNEVQPTLNRPKTSQNGMNDQRVPSENVNGEDQYAIRDGAQASNDFQNIQDKGRTLAEYIYGSKKPLSEKEKEQMAQMEQREGRLQPVDFGVLGGQRIAGNPFSIDSRRLLTGAGELAEGFINKERAKRRGEFSEDLEDMREQEATNQQIEQGQQNFLKQFVPQSYFNKMQEEADMRAENRAQNNAIEMEELRQQGDKDLATLRSTLQENINNGGSKDYSSQVVQQYFKAAYPSFYNMENNREALINQKVNLQEQMSEATTASEREEINRQIDSVHNELSLIEQRMDSLGSVMADEMQEMGVVPPSSLRKDTPYTEADIQAYADEMGVSIEEAREAFEAEFN